MNVHPDTEVTSFAYVLHTTVFTSQTIYDIFSTTIGLRGPNAMALAGNMTFNTFPNIQRGAQLTINATSTRGGRSYGGFATTNPRSHKQLL